MAQVPPQNVVSLERAWRALMDRMRFTQPQRVKSSQLWTGALHHRIRRGR